MKQVLEKKLTIEEFLHKCSHEISVRKFPKEDLSKDEKRHRKKLRRDFKKKVKEDSSTHKVIKDAKKRGFSFSVHHIIPRTLGGEDHKSNYAYVEDGFHLFIHKYIEKQGEIAEGKRKIIRIPEMAGKLWILPSYVEVPEAPEDPQQKMSSPKRQKFKHNNHKIFLPIPLSPP